MLKKFIFIPLILCFYTTALLSAEKIAYVDLDYLFNNSNLGKKIILSLKNENKKNLDTTKKKSTVLKELEQDLIKKKNIISKDEFDKKFSDLSLKIKKYHDEKKKAKIEFENNKNQQIKNFFEKINPILKEYMSENSISLILDKKNIILADSKLEITESLKKIIDKKFN